MVVTVRGGDPGEILAAIYGLPAPVDENPDRFGVLRVGKDMLVIPGATLKVMVLVHFFPGGSSIVR
jgi:hypothetical protein